MKLCVNEESIKCCDISEIEDCCECNRQGFWVNRYESESELIELASKGADNYMTLQSVVHDLSKLTADESTIDDAVKASLTDIEMRIYDLLAHIDFNYSGLFYNLFYNMLANTSKGSAEQI